MPRTLFAPAALALLTPFTSHAPAAEAPDGVELRTHRVGDATSFTVRFRAPAGMRPPVRNWRDSGVLTREGQRVRSARLPRLVPQDDRTSAVYPTFWLPPGDRPEINLEFVGKAHTQALARLLLVYPTEKERPARARPSPAPGLETLDRAGAPRTLDFRNARPDAPPP